MSLFGLGPDSDNDSSDPNNQPPPPPEWQRYLLPIILVLTLVWALISVQGWGSLTSTSSVIPYSTVIEQARMGNIAEIVIEGDSVRGRFQNSASFTLPNGREVRATEFTASLPPLNAEQLISEMPPGVVVSSNPPEESPLLFILVQLAPVILIIGFFVWMSRRAQGQMSGIFGFGASKAREYSGEATQVTFKDVAGQESAKEELEEVVEFLKSPAKYIQLGARVPKGVLLVGPPGTGKTLLARAVAGEANVAFFSIAASEFVEMFVGVGASRVRDLFNKAKEAAPSIIFIDEIDAVGRRRGAGLGGGHDEREQTLNQILSEMDGFDQEANIIMMAATNRADVLDPALLRPGRFDRHVTVDIPDRHGRKAILEIHTRGKPLASDVNLEHVAKATVGFTGADIENLANEAALIAARKDKSQITTSHFTEAFERIILGNKRPPLSNQEERRVVAYHEAGHALVNMLTPHADPVLKVTIVPRGPALGVAMQLPEDDRRNYSRKYLEARLHGLLGGRIAEEVVFDDITTGASNDLKHVTDLARRMVSQFGMTEAIGPVNFGDNESQPFLGYSISQGRNYSEETAAKIDAEVRKIVDEAYENTRHLVIDNRDKLDALANELLEHETIEYERIAELVGVEVKDLPNLTVRESQPNTASNGASSNGSNVEDDETAS